MAVEAPEICQSGSCHFLCHCSFAMVSEHHCGNCYLGLYRITNEKEEEE